MLELVHQMFRCFNQRWLVARKPMSWRIPPFCLLPQNGWYFVAISVWRTHYTLWSEIVWFQDWTDLISRNRESLRAFVILPSAPFFRPRCDSKCISNSRFYDSFGYWNYRNIFWRFFSLLQKLTSTSEQCCLIKKFQFKELLHGCSSERC